MNELIDSIKSNDIKPKSKLDLRCAPSQKFKNGSCVDVDVLIDMAYAYNKEFPNKKIKLLKSLDTINPKKYKRYLVKEFNNRLEDVCDNQQCWVKQSFTNKMKQSMEKQLKKYTFRTEGPEGKFEWLNTFNIDNVMKQYEKSHEDFKFLGAVPIDFADLSQLEIANLDLDELYNKNKTKLGVIFNLDEHYKSGSHWVSLFVDIKEGKVLFSDSYGFRPEKRIRKFMRKVANNIKKNNVEIKHNKKRHQFGGSECGVYSINFIVRLLNNESFESITKNKLTDEEVNKCREVYFGNVILK